MTYEKAVVVTRKTRLEELVERYASRAQAKFVIERAGGDFADYQREDDAYRRAVDRLRDILSRALKVQCIERALVPTFLFAPKDVVVTVGQDGLVANTAKYVLDGQPIVAVNPDPERFDGILLPFRLDDLRSAIAAVLSGRYHVRHVTLAEARLNDGQRLLAFNDLFIGARTHVSARYRLRVGKRAERQSSSGIIVSTGAGSTGWLSSVFNMVSGILRFAGRDAPDVRTVKLSWEDDRLVYVVREPFVSRTSQAGLVAGLLGAEEALEIESLMPSGGVIFSDGIEADLLNFTSGVVATIGVAKQKARLVVKDAPG